MKKIALLCAAGMSTSVLVRKMQDAANEMGFECEIQAYPASQANEVGKDADVMLLGPQVRFELNKVKALCPNVPVEVIDMRSYGTMNGKAVVELARKLIEG